MSIDIKKLGGIAPNVTTPSPRGKNGLQGEGPSFQDTLSNLDKMADLQKIKALPTQELKFSNHAIERMQSRGVSFTPEQMSKLESAVKKAAEKGGKDSLVLMNDTALIVSVKNNTVVTVVDKSSLKDNVFTNIDSTVVI